MKKLLLLWVLSCFSRILIAQTYPVIRGMTVTPAEPNDDDQVMIVTSVETPYPGHRLSKNHQLIQQDFKIDLFACYYSGSQGTPQAHVDTFYVGTLAHGYWSVTFKARLSSDAGSCAPADSSDDALYVQVDPAPLSVYSAGLKPQVIWPNPCGDLLFVDINNVSVRIFSVTGEEIAEKIKSEDGRINTSGFAAGVYIIEITSGARISRSRFIKL